jgi:UDP-N-acetylglucosamine diphosphorylase / glucose-1-phosphate thymidylyltransferase / UDP-N-acetylgalactosamine diphosphorylase / glucosamine-1-phosphate N-acetyltransferase / galactosamine-1-phosphate N-acetyltransferase
LWRECKDVKALILAGGRGKRMEQLSENENKCMLTLHGKHLIEYSLDSAAAISEVSEIVIVVGYRAESIINRFGTFYKDKKISYVIQKEQAGLVHAMDCAKNYIGSDDFFLFLGDEVILGGRHTAMLDLMKKQDLFCVCGVFPQKNLEAIKRTYSLIHGPDGRIYRLIEKPRKPFNALMGTGNILFRRAIFDYIEFTPINLNRGEKELPDLIQCAIDDGEPIMLFQVCDHYININSLEEWNMVEDNWPAEPAN